MSVVDLLAHEYGWTDQYILNLTVAKARSFRDATDIRRKSEFRRTVSLEEWSTRLIAMSAVASAGEGASEIQREIAKSSFPWNEDGQGPDEEKPLDEGDDLSFLETGDTAAAEKNTGKTLPALLQ